MKENFELQPVHTWAWTFSSWSFFAFSSNCRAMDTSSEFLFLSFFIFSSATKVAFRFPLLDDSFWKINSDKDFKNKDQTPVPAAPSTGTNIWIWQARWPEGTFHTAEKNYT